MRLPTRLPAHHPAQKWIAAMVMSVIVGLIAVGARSAPGLRNATAAADDVLYDALYHCRTPEDRRDGNVVILAIDDKALREMNDGLLNGRHLGWPWPRSTWALLLPYLEHSGARAVVFDVLFNELSPYNIILDDDQELGDAAAASKIPVVFATQVNPDGRPVQFAPRVQNPLLGAVNDKYGPTVRWYDPSDYGMASLAMQAATATVGRQMPTPPTGPFLLHYYGPHSLGEGSKSTTTFPFLSAGRALGAAAEFKENGKLTSEFGFDPSVFRGRVVLVGGISIGLGDLKASPLSRQYPGVEVQATAIENLIHGQRVRPVGLIVTWIVTFACAFLACVCVIFPRQAWLKLLAATAITALLVLIAALMFRGSTIRWLPVATPLLALVLATVAAFAWSYLTEDRARQVLFKALSQNLSPEMASKVMEDPEFMNRLGGDRREMTVMFTDIAGFTTLSETLDVERLTALMNYYLEEMSSIVLRGQAYLDKYIGDAIMSFWNGIPDQPDHAVAACRTALRLREREREIQPELRRLGAKRVLTRIGINTGPMSLGNMGSSRKFAFTVLGDSVNLGSRLEGANKVYGSQIMVAQSTAERVKDRFVLRRLDLFTAKGKTEPIAVYELLVEGTADAELRARIDAYESALRLYQQQRWDEAESAWKALLARFPDDEPSRAMLERIEKFRHAPPPPDWDGVYVAKDK